MTKPKDFQNFLVTDNLRIKENLYDFGDPFPQVVDVMVRILTTEGASVIALFEEGKLPVPSSFEGDSEDYWWELAEANSDVFVRRIKVFSSGV